MYEFTTLDEADRAVAAGIRDATGDNPEVGEDDVAHDVIVAVAERCEPAIARELCRTQLGWMPEELR